jgi:hypothetical protein
MTKAKAKKKRTARSGARKVGRATKRAVGHVGVDAGLLASGFMMLTENSGATGKNPLGEAMASGATLSDRIKYTGQSLMGNVTVRNATPILAGAIISASPRIPIINMVAKPVDRELKKRFKVGL